MLSFQSAYRRSSDLSGASVDDDWQCNPAVAREVLEITLPLLAKPSGPKDAKDQPTEHDTVAQEFQKIAVYQDIRAMALYANDIILSIVGALMGLLLPVLYAGSARAQRSCGN